MPQVPIPLFVALAGAILIWLIILSIFLYKAISHYNKLSRGVTKQNLGSLLEKVLSQIDLSRNELGELRLRCEKIEQEELLHAQKIGLLRFNPFSDTGGDQSFILAILNGRDDGVLISSLHSRSSTRWYAKKVKAGKGIEHELSDEEKLAIKQAKPIQ